jgi:hypothetical protein
MACMDRLSQEQYWKTYGELMLVVEIRQLGEHFELYIFTPHNCLASGVDVHCN